MKVKLVGLVGVLISAACLGAPHGLLTEHRENPFGLGVAAPRLSWKLPSGVRAQTAYEIEAKLSVSAAGFRAPGMAERRLGPGSHELRGSASSVAGFARAVRRRSLSATSM